MVRLHPGSREPAVSQEPIMHPKAKFEGLQKQVEAEMAQRKEKDYHWEDVIDVSSICHFLKQSLFTHYGLEPVPSYTYAITRTSL